MGCDQCTCADKARTCGGCDEPITGRHGFTSVKTERGYTYLHAACAPEDAA